MRRIKTKKMNKIIGKGGNTILPSYNELVEDIKRKRKKLDLTQKELAKRTGVSQSLIAKLEQKKNIPNYRTIKKIYDFLEKKIDSSQQSAREIANPKIFSISPEKTRREAAELMSEKNLNAIPVKDKKNFLGVVKSSSLTLVSEETPVKEIMDYSFSIISDEIGKEVVEKLLKFNEIILVQKEGEVTGFITEKDIL